ncbi:endoglucanase [Cellvibrio zantedeschiae]|uniref:Endoglucanase n=1 Tax=Cellvibrio zantedeschiae TaxID=1237077 RepID=A0ABQ3AZZ2_9GAMM|nr:GDSL-type esterase/lipase family protein [Cellvibrio zantedeschiae]GGY72117.1 endoglucanase [Cellvibrio zantedeschiae]
MKNNMLLISLFSIALLGCADAGTKSDKANAAAAKTASSEAFTGANSRLIGRFDRNTNGQAKFTWPGSAIEFRFEGSKASINIASQAKTRFAVTIDGKTTDLWTEAGNHTYVLASNLGSGTHTLRLTRLNESTAGVTSFISDPQVDGKLLSPPQTPEKQLLVIGDSITAGYGVEGASEACHYTLDTSNQQLTYAALAASALGADLHAIAWSGIGAWRSYGEKTPTNPTILTRHTRTLADDTTSVWNPSQYQPDAILINIGTNDYWEGSTSDDYRLNMAKLIAQIQTDYKSKPIYLIVSPMLTNKVHAAQKQVLDGLAVGNVKVLDLGEGPGSDGLGCDYHPNSKTHARLGKVLEKNLKADLKW